jgi:hypothetical protein
MKTLKDYNSEFIKWWREDRKSDNGGIGLDSIELWWEQAIKQILEEVVGDDFDEKNDYCWKGRVKDIQVFAYNQAKDEIRANAAKVLGE